ncbi:MAG: DUF2125 domain-containing protein [Alphaproteobacteria bacterium]
MAGRNRRGFGGWLIGLVVILALAWVGYWFAARTAATFALDRLNSAPFAGQQLGCAGQRLSGFPLSIDVGCRTVTMAATSGAMKGELGGLQASALLYRPGFVTATLTSPLTVNAPADGIAATLSWSLGTAEAQAGLDGITSLSGNFHNPQLATGGAPLLPITGALAARANATAKPAGKDAYAFTARAEALELTRPGGRELPAFDVDLAVVALDFGDSLGTDPRAAILAWLRRGGTVRVDHVRLASTGATVETSGELTLSSDGILSGSLALRYANLEALSDLAETLRPGSAEQMGPVLAVLNAMTVPAEINGAPARETTLVISDGLVAVGIIPIAVLPALRF